MPYRLAVLLLFALLLAAACGPGQPETSTSDGAATASADERTSRTRVEVDGDPSVGLATVVVYLLEDGAGVSGAEVEVTGDMTHAGMAPVIAPAREVEPGLYRTEDFAFTMAGDWIVTAEIVLPDGSRATTETVLTVPSP